MTVSVSQAFIAKNDMAVTDISYKDGYLNIVNAEKDVPSIFTKSIINAPYFQKSLVETIKAKTFEFTATASTTYSMNLYQVVRTDGSRTLQTIIYESGTTTSATIIRDALISAVNSCGLNVTAVSAGASSFTISGVAGFPLYYEDSLVNITASATTAQTTYAPNGTPADAITTVIAPVAAVGSQIAGTSTVTVTTLAAHLLRPGDYVEIAGAATFLMTYRNNVPLSNNADFGKTFSGATGGLFRVATTPTSTTFTLDGVTGNGATNSNGITINIRSGVFIQTLAGATIANGKTLTVASVATMTIAPISLNGTVGTAGSSGSFRVGNSAGGSTQRFLLENVYASGTNSGTITITEVAQFSRFTGAELNTQIGSDAGFVTTETYSQITFEFSEPAENYLGASQSLGKHFNIYFNEITANSALTQFTLYKALEQGYVR